MGYTDFELFKLGRNEVLRGQKVKICSVLLCQIKRVLRSKKLGGNWKVRSAEGWKWPECTEFNFS